MNQGWITFNECEHTGDLDGYFTDLVESGAKILDSTINEDSEEGRVKISVTGMKSFMEKFRKTDSFALSNLS